MTYCSHCGSPNKASSKFCNNCGALLSAAFDVRCAICGSANNIESMYCSTCGGRLEASPTQPADRVDTLARIATATLAPRPAEAQIGEVKAEPNAQAPWSDAERRGPDTPEWTKRLRPTSSSQASAAPAEPPEVEGVMPAWLSELRAPNEPEDVDGGVGTGSNQDWLAKLREAAMIEPEPAKEEPTTAFEETEPPPIPQWFAHIRPPSPARPPEPAPPEGVLEPASPPTKQPEPSQVREQPTAQSAELEGLPEWLVQLQSLPVPIAQEPSATRGPMQASPSAPSEESISKASEVTPERLTALTEETPDGGQAGRLQVTFAPTESSQFTPPQIDGPEPPEADEIPLTREEALGLPDWLAAPIETGTLLAKIEDFRADKTRAETAHGKRGDSDTRAKNPESAAELKETLARETPAQGELVPNQADDAEAHQPASRLSRMIAGIRTWLQALWRRYFPAREPEDPPAETTLIPRQVNSRPEQAQRRLQEPASGAGPAASEAAAGKPESDRVAPWPLPEDYQTEMPIIADEILDPPVLEESPVAPIHLGPTAVQPHSGQLAADRPTVEGDILGLAIPVRPAAEQPIIG